jgi:hypothetical protein
MTAADAVAASLGFLLVITGVALYSVRAAFIVAASERMT